MRPLWRLSALMFALALSGACRAAGDPTPAALTLTGSASTAGANGFSKEDEAAWGPVLAPIMTLPWVPSESSHGTGKAAPAPLGGAAGAEAGLGLEAQDGLSEADYDQVEKAGEVADSSEYSADALITRFRNGDLFGVEGSLVELTMQPGRKASVGSEYVAYREDGELDGETLDGHDAGMLLQNVGVLKVVEVHGKEVSARIEKQYVNVLPGDWVRLRDTERRKYDALRYRKIAAPKGLEGAVIGVLPPSLMAVDGDVVYLNVGSAQGLSPGMRLTVVGTADTESYRPDDFDSDMPMSPIQRVEPPSDDLSEMTSNGPIGVLEVVNATAGACAARVLHSVGAVSVGDHVRYP